MKQKRYVEMTRQEWRLAMEGLNWFRNELIAAGRYTNAVDEVLLKIVKAKPQKREYGVGGLENGKMHNRRAHRAEIRVVGDHYLIAGKNELEERSIGVWGQRHLRYLKAHRRVLYVNLLTSGALTVISWILTAAEELFLRLVNQMAAAESITEALKAANQMEWVRRMNSVGNRAVEIVNAELINL